MGSAAGTGIRTGETDDAHILRQLLLASVIQDGKLLRAGIKDFNGSVFPDQGIDIGLDFLHILCCQQSIEVNGNHIAAQVEAYIVIAKAGMDQAADHMLPRMLLHEVKAPFPVDLPDYQATRRDRLLCTVQNLTVFLMYIRHLYAQLQGGIFLLFPLLLPTGIGVCDEQEAMIGRLPSPLRVEGGLIQKDQPAPFPFPAIHYPGGKFLSVRIFIV